MSTVDLAVVGNGMLGAWDWRASIGRIAVVVWTLTICGWYAEKKLWVGFAFPVDMACWYSIWACWGSGRLWMKPADSFGVAWIPMEVRIPERSSVGPRDPPSTKEILFSIALWTTTRTSSMLRLLRILIQCLEPTFFWQRFYWTPFQPHVNTLQKNWPTSVVKICFFFNVRCSDGGKSTDSPLEDGLLWRGVGRFSPVRAALWRPGHYKIRSFSKRARSEDKEIEGTFLENSENNMIFIEMIFKTIYSCDKKIGRLRCKHCTNYQVKHWQRRCGRELRGSDLTPTLRWLLPGWDTGLCAAVRALWFLAKVSWKIRRFPQISTARRQPWMN